MPSIRRKKPKFQPVRVSFGFVIFSIIFIYMAVRLIISANDTDLAVFQVEESTYDVNFTETGLAIRSETVYYSSTSGYICYYIRDGEKVAKGANVYSVDETGSMADALYDVQSSDEEVLSEEDYEYIEKQIRVFKANFNTSDFSEVYEFKTTLDSKVLELYEDMALEQLQADSSFDSTFAAFKSTVSGVVTYYTDGYENFDVENISSSDFDKSDYEKVSLKNSDIVASGSAVYKIVDSESWQIAVELTKDEYNRVKDNTSVKFTINDSTKRYTATFDTIEQDDSYFIVLNMTKYMAEYIDDRYLNITFIFSETKGLKIPNSSIVEKEVIMIPVAYLSAGSGSTTKKYFNQMVLTAEGTTSVEQISPTIYFTDDHFCYVDPDDIDEDAVLVAEDSDVTFSVTTAGKYSLSGVYCVTQGTALFKQIEIMVDGDDYTIIEPNTSNGIVAYDRIALHASEVYENQIIY